MHVVHADTPVFYTYKTAFNYSHLGFTQKSGRLPEVVIWIFEFIDEEQ